MFCDFSNVFVFLLSVVVPLPVLAVNEWARLFNCQQRQCNVASQLQPAQLYLVSIESFPMEKFLSLYMTEKRDNHGLREPSQIFFNFRIKIFKMILFDFQAFALPDSIQFTRWLTFSCSDVPIFFFTPSHIMRVSNQQLPSQLA